MTQRAPDKLLAIADQHALEKTDANDVSQSPEEKSAPPFAEMAAPEILDDLRDKVAYAKREFDAAINDGNDTKLNRAERLYSNLVELWHKVEVKIQEIKRATGASIDRFEVEAQYAADWRTVRDMRDAMPRKIIAELERSDSKKIHRILRVLEPDLRQAIDRVRAGEEAIFRNNVADKA